MAKSIYFSFKIEGVEFKSNLETLNISTPFDKRDELNRLTDELQLIGYRLAKVDELQFITKDNRVFIEGLAYEIEKPDYVIPTMMFSS